ncbi:MAG: AsnC family transcriptional regulator [Nitrososphaerota archaeon]
MTFELDELDRQIIELMRRDARRSYQSIGRELGVSEGTVRKRVKRLIKSGVIKRFTIEVERPQQVQAISGYKYRDGSQGCWPSDASRITFSTASLGEPAL